MSGDAVVSGALAAGLSVTGWRSVRLVAEERLAAAVRGASRMPPVTPMTPATPAPTPPGASSTSHRARASRTRRRARVVLVADGTGWLPDPRPALTLLSGPLVVAVGGRVALASLADAVERLVAVAALDADQPFADLVRTLDQVLRLDVELPPPAELVASLRAREREARLFTVLTPREQDVLGAILAGRSAAELAASERVSLPTVRTHIRGILAKLGVSSQLAAVALTHRSAREPRLVERLRDVHQF